MRVAGRIGGGPLAALMLLAALASCSASTPRNRARERAPAVPTRIVSMNPCIDAVLREVADPVQIAGISHYSHDARSTSVPLDWARRFPAIGDGAEDVVAARPDLVLAGPHVAPQTVAALDRLGIALVRMGVPTTVAASQAQVAKIGRITGHDARARALNARINAALVAAAPRTGSTRAPSALIWQDGGLVPGRGTLADELLVRAGFRSASTALGLAQWDMVPLERLLSAAPDIVLTGNGGMDSGTGAMGARHPVLIRAGSHIRFAGFPSHMLHCGGPVIINAAARLAHIRRDWGMRSGV